MAKPLRLSANQDGFASIVIALTLIIVMALISVGFAQLSSREQQSALNNQLAAEAQYAAESGVNDAVAQVNSEFNGPKGAGGITSKTSCPPDTSQYLSNNVLGSGVSWTCVLINPNPPSLEYTGVQADSSRTVAFVSGSASNFSSITISWQSSDGNNTPLTTMTPSSSNDLLTASDWATKNYAPVIQMSLTSLAGTLTRNNLIGNTYTNYLLPYKQADGDPYVTANASNTNISKIGSCSSAPVGNNEYDCTATITDLNTNSLLLHFDDFYDAADISITGTTLSGPATFQGGQVLVDATGKAQDVLKRIQVRVPITEDSADLPQQGLEVGSLCKRLESMPGSNSVSDPYTVANDACSLN